MSFSKFNKAAVVLIPSAYFCVDGNPLVGLVVGFVLLVLAFVTE